MAEIVKKSAGPAKSMGVRYGRTIRQKIGELEKQYHVRQKCPFCSKMNVKRVAAGIWNCKSCNTKFSGAAYAVKKEDKTEAAN